MAESEAPLERVTFGLSRRQRSLRAWTLGLLALLGVITVAAYRASLFSLRHHGPLTPLVRRALAAKATFLLGYISIAFVIVVALLVIAWMEYREIQLKMAVARRDIWRDVAGRGNRPTT